MGFPVALVIKNPPANAGDVRDMGLIPGQEDPVEEGLAGYILQGGKESDTTEVTYPLTRILPRRKVMHDLSQTAVVHFSLAF